MNEANELNITDATAPRPSGSSGGPGATKAGASIELTAPSAADAPGVHQLIARCKPLDLNSTYAYLLLCHHFADTCVVARRVSQLVGFISGYVLPNDPRTFFVWQVAVHPDVRGARLGARMLLHLLSRQSVSSARYMETTVSPSNTASRRMFHGFATSIDAAIEERMLFDRDAFGDEDHEEEMLLKIGPIDTGAFREGS